MWMPISRMSRLRAMSWREMSERGRQEMRAFREQLHLTRECAISETQWRALCGSLRLCGEKNDRPPAFLPVLENRESIAQTMMQRFPAQREAIINRATRAQQGILDLLGHQQLNFGSPIDWHFDPIEARHSPLVHWSRFSSPEVRTVTDRKLLWELNRHNHFVTLGQAYLLTGDERFAETFVQQAESWMEANPMYYGLNWASSLELAFRSYAWLWALRLCSTSSHLTPAFVHRALRCLLAQAEHIESYLSHYHSPNTHLTGEALGLVALGTSLPALPEAARWRRQGIAILLEQLQRQIQSDGVYFERSTYYHRYTVDFYLHLLLLIQAQGEELPAEARQKIAAALEYLLWITRPDGTSPLLGDDDGGRLISLSVREGTDFRDTLALGALLFQRGDWKYVAGEAPDELLWLLGADALRQYDALPVDEPSEKARAFTESGYFVVRDGWSPTSSTLLIDCGTVTGNGCHAHASALSFEYIAGGVTWLTDPGTFAYAGAERQSFRSSMAHNTVTVDDESQMLPGREFTWKNLMQTRALQFREGNGCFLFEGEHDGYLRLSDPVQHRRTISFSEFGHAAGHPAALLIWDYFTALETHRYALHFHFPAGCQVSIQNVDRECDILVTASEGQQLSIRALSPAISLRGHVIQGWTSLRYGQREPALIAVVEASGKGAQEFVTLLIPSGEKRPHDTGGTQVAESCPAMPPANRKFLHAWKI